MPPRKPLNARQVAVLEDSAKGLRKYIKLIDLGKPGVKQLRRELVSRLETIQHDLDFWPREGA
jgi:hypothetical protein